MFLVKNKITNEIVYHTDKDIDLLTIYNLNLYRNYANYTISDYDILELDQSCIIDKIRQSTKIFHKNNEYLCENNESSINYDNQIDKMKQLQCQIDKLQKEISVLKKGSS